MTSSEWATINRHLQTVGTAACSVSHLILLADILATEDKNPRAAAMLLCAARTVLAEQQKARSARARAIREVNARRKKGKPA